MDSGFRLSLFELVGIDSFLNIVLSDGPSEANYLERFLLCRLVQFCVVMCVEKNWVKGVILRVGRNFTLLFLHFRT